MKPNLKWWAFSALYMHKSCSILCSEIIFKINFKSDGNITSKYRKNLKWWSCGALSCSTLWSVHIE